MNKKLPEPRFITPASVDIGDVIKVTWKVGEIEHTRTAEVAWIDDRVFYAKDFQEIFRWDGPPSKLRITLLNRPDIETRVPLF